MKHIINTVKLDSLGFSFLDDSIFNVMETAISSGVIQKIESINQDEDFKIFKRKNESKTIISIAHFMKSDNIINLMKFDDGKINLTKGKIIFSIRKIYYENVNFPTPIFLTLSCEENEWREFIPNYKRVKNISFLDTDNLKPLVEVEFN